MRGREVREFEINIYTLLFRMDNQQGPVELCSMLCGSLDGRELWGRMGTCICMAGSLCCSPETITALLPGYSPIQSKKFFKNGSVLKETQKREDLCICIADSLCCTVETS